MVQSTILTVNRGPSIMSSRFSEIHHDRASTTGEPDVPSRSQRPKQGDKCYHLRCTIAGYEHSIRITSIAMLEMWV